MATQQEQKATRKLLGISVGYCSNCGHHSREHPVSGFTDIPGTFGRSMIASCRLCKCQVTVPEINSPNVDPFSGRGPS